MAILKPDRYFERLTCIDVQRDLLDKGIARALLDVDNTVRDRAKDSIPEDVRVWIDQARKAGVEMCLFSNSWHKSTLRFGRELDLPVVMRSVKPLPIGTVRALREVSGTKRDTVVIGDQVLTDVLAAHLAGVHAYLVVPLSDVNIKSALWQRRVEQHVLKDLTPES